MAKSLKIQILFLRKKGLNYDEIRKELSCAKATISYHCRKEGLGASNKTLTEEQVLKVKDLYLKRNTQKKISEILNVSLHAVKWQTRTIDRENIGRSKSVVNWRKRIKERLVNLKGGKCQKCGYDKCIEALQFHHIDPSKKDFSIGGKSWAFERMKKEVDKCILLCANCHIEEHNGVVAETVLAAAC